MLFTPHPGTKSTFRLPDSHLADKSWVCSEIFAHPRFPSVSAQEYIVVGGVIKSVNDKGSHSIKI